MPSLSTVRTGLVEVGLIWMTLLLLAISETGIDALEQTSPMMYFTLSWLMTLFAALTAGSGCTGCPRRWA